MWVGFSRDVRLIRKHFQKGIGRLWTADNFLHMIGAGLIGVYFASLVFQKDYAIEIIDTASPLRYNNPKNIWNPLSKAFENISQKRNP